MKKKKIGKLGVISPTGEARENELTVPLKFFLELSRANFIRKIFPELSNSRKT